MAGTWSVRLQLLLALLLGALGALLLSNAHQVKVLVYGLVLRSSMASVPLLRHAPASCNGSLLFAAVPWHGLGNKLVWVTSAMVLAKYHSRCLVLVYNVAHGEAPGWAALSLEFTPSEFTPPVLWANALPPGIASSAFDRADDQFQHIVPPDGYNCLAQFSTNCHALVEGALRDSFFDPPGDKVLGKSFLAIRPEGMSLTQYNAAMYTMMAALEPAPALRELVDAALVGCRRLARPGALLIGAHFRAGDNCNDGNKKNLPGACATVDHVLLHVLRLAGMDMLAGLPGGSEARAVVLLATTDPAAMAAAQHALAPAGIPVCSTGSLEAVVDMRALSHADILVGSKYSTFSFVAARWGNLPTIEAGR
jgi:hypothetical protein